MNLDDIHANLAHVHAQIGAACARVGRNPDSVTLVAVSKTHPAEALQAAYQAGARHFGENRLEEAQTKIPTVNALIDTPPTWHMIGHIQSRKAKQVPPVFDVIHSLDTLKLAERLHEWGIAAQRPVRVLLEVNISGEASKSGFAAHAWDESPTHWDELCTTLEAVFRLQGLQIQGLMTMAPIVDEMEQARPVFAGLRRLRDAIQTRYSYPLPDLSMGMTDDYPIAIEEGATLIRVGRAIFGPRSV